MKFSLPSTYFAFPYWTVFPAGALGYIAYSSPVGVAVWLLIIIIIIIYIYCRISATRAINCTISTPIYCIIFDIKTREAI